jgi:RES domain-containing protein
VSRIKRQMEEGEARGFRQTGLSVCAACIGDNTLGEFVIEVAEDEPCGYCGTEPAASLDNVLEHMLEAIRFEFRPASEESPPWDSAEGGYQAPAVLFPELLFDEMDEDFGDERVRQDIEEALLPFDEAWFERDWYALRPHQQLVYSWRRFATAVQRRSTPLLRPPARPSDDPDAWAEPEDVLDVIAAVVANLPAAIRTLGAGERIWRARPNSHSATAAALGPAPAGTLVEGGRMNQAGQIFFYGALDRDTAVREATHKSGATLVTVGPFEAAIALTFLDLSGTNLRLPSVFDLAAQGGRTTVRFLREFAGLISLPAADKHPRGYFPTQMVTEYVRTRLGAHVGRTIDGILYPSARSAGSNAVLFLGGEACADLGAPPPSGVRLLLDASDVAEVRTA